MVAPPGEQSTDDGGPGVAEVLRDEHRRTIVRHLVAAGGETSLMRLAPRLAGATDTPLPEVIADCHDRHLPALEACGLATHESGMVSLEIPPADAEAALEDVPGGG